MTRRRISFFLTIIVFFIFIIFGVVSIMASKDPVEEEFNGIVSDYRRLYPGLIAFHLKEQKMEFYMAKSLDEFKKSLSIGDSISKPKGDFYIYIYKKTENKFTLYRKFIYD